MVKIEINLIFLMIIFFSLNTISAFLFPRFFKALLSHCLDRTVSQSPADPNRLPCYFIAFVSIPITPRMNVADVSTLTTGCVVVLLLEGVRPDVLVGVRVVLP